MSLFCKNIVSKIVLNSYCILDSDFASLGSLLEPFWDDFGSLLPFGGGLGLVWGDFGHRLASNLDFWAQFGRLGCNFDGFGSLLSQFGLQNRYNLSSKVKSLITFEQFETKFRSKVPISICQSQYDKLLSSTDAAVSA